MGEKLTSILVFGFDISESSQIRRIRLMQTAGFDVSSAAMRRDNMNLDFVPDWPNIELAQAGNAKMLNRLVAILKSSKTMLAHRSMVRDSDVVWARNFDMLVIAWLCRVASRSSKTRQTFVYECLDIHSLFTRTDWIGRAMRAVERLLLRQIDLLVVSSPGFMQNYFEPHQGYDRPSALIENKISFRGEAPKRPPARPEKAKTSVPVVGWVGTLRCPASFELLLGLASEMKDTVRIRMAGIVHEHMLTAFRERIQEFENIEFLGAYDYPMGLTEIYRNCDFVWSQDLWQMGANSDWLLPNRIYEASWNGCPSIALETTETGHYIRENEMGFVLSKPTVGCLMECISKNWPGAAVEMSNQLLSRDRAAFEQNGSDIIRALQMAESK
ncbi:glycosyl transferase [Rhodobacteraceae bacterium]|nr:glycosyl transferase [Paracoccaceae bacterium]